MGGPISAVKPAQRQTDVSSPAGSANLTSPLSHIVGARARIRRMGASAFTCGGREREGGQQSKDGGGGGSAEQGSRIVAAGGARWDRQDSSAACRYSQWHNPPSPPSPQILAAGLSPSSRGPNHQGCLQGARRQRPETGAARPGQQLSTTGRDCGRSTNTARPLCSTRTVSPGRAAAGCSGRTFELRLCTSNMQQVHRRAGHPPFRGPVSSALWLPRMPALGGGRSGAGQQLGADRRPTRKAGQDSADQAGMPGARAG